MSTDYFFPVRLADPKLGFNLEDINNYIIAGEVPPNEMFKLLTEEWKLSEKLSIALISLYGGHIWDVYQTIDRMRVMKENVFLFNSIDFANIGRCFKEGIDNAYVVRTLKQLAETGFVPLEDRDDPIAKIINKNNVGGVVAKSAMNIGLPMSVWDSGCDFGLVPTCHSIRILIAKYLIGNKHVE